MVAVFRRALFPGSNLVPVRPVGADKRRSRANLTRSPLVKRGGGVQPNYALDDGAARFGLVSRD